MSLPVPATRSSFVGRDDDLDQLRRLIQYPDTRLLTITGPGGVGKTRLTVEFMRQVDHYAGSIWFVPLAHVHRPEFVMAAIAAAIGARDINAGETVDRIAERVAGLPALLVLDNLEQIIECGGTIAQLLQAAPDLRILATSRQPLRIHGEIEFPLRPLPVETRVQEAVSPAEQLFLIRAQEASYGFTATDENRAAIRQITQRLGGLPLALELAASWVKVLPPQRLLENLDRQLDVLIRGPLDLPERQQTMRSAIAWSYQLLTADERQLFRRLGVFDGTFTLADVEALACQSGRGCASRELQQSATLEILSSLVTKSLVQAVDVPIDPAQPEYTMLETIGAYAREQLSIAAEASKLRDRHLAHFTQLAEQWTVELGSAQRDRRLMQLDREYPNFRAALEWADAAGNTEAGMRLIAALWVYWDWRGFHAEGARWCERILTVDVPIAPHIRASALYAGSAIAFMQANYPRTLELAEACLAAAEESGSDHTIGRALIALGNAAYDQGDLGRAETAYSRSLDRIRSTGEPTALQVALVNLGFVRYQQERFEEARALFDEAIALESDTGKSAGFFWALVGSSQVDLWTGHPNEAETRLRAIVDQQRRADSGQLGAALVVLAALLRNQGRLEDANTLSQESLLNRMARDERAFLTDSLAEIGAIAIAAGQLEMGVTLMAAADTQRNRLGYGLPDLERRRHRQLAEQAQTQLRPAAFEQARARGEQISIVEALALAGSYSMRAQTARPGAAVTPDNPGLTRREQEVLRLIVGGLTDRQIAHTLCISSGTASRHVANILHKLDVRARSAAAAWAIRNGWD